MAKKGYVVQTERLTRAELRPSEVGQVWIGATALAGDVKFLEWSEAGGLRHATLVSVSR